ncbi:hypothetical protein FVE67_08605 [Thermosulfurimonas marina]|uniref:Uncharacterized protein n=1 Tax=Thermosulfurimonas marina TaxID=2047767 RepID=A0A6H1WUG2_9BACT|nr:hypothetical protein [Thermosulfurimonas marina]QJA06843.1 hypothetical protein FVE67_08605 [Thermosulfurimonas marina]
MDHELTYEAIKREVFVNTIKQADRLIKRGLDQCGRLVETTDPEERRHLGFVLNMTLMRLLTLFRILTFSTLIGEPQT